MVDLREIHRTISIIFSKFTFVILNASMQLLPIRTIDSKKGSQYLHGLTESIAIITSETILYVMDDILYLISNLFLF
jgi:hypothetical protein